MAAAVGLVSLPGSSVAAHRTRRTADRPRSCSRSSAGAVTSSERRALTAWVRARMAVVRATRNERSISTWPSAALGTIVTSPACTARAAAAAGGPVGSVDLEHDLTRLAQVAGQPCAVGAGTLHAPGLDLAESPRPRQQGSVAGWGGGDADGVQAATELVLGVGDVDVAVGVDPDSDAWRLGVCDGGDGHLPPAPCLGGWHAPAGWADSTAMSLWAQASIRSGLLGWRCKASGRGVEPTDQVKGTKPVDRWGQALTAATREIIAVDLGPGGAGHPAHHRGPAVAALGVAAAHPAAGLEPAAARAPGQRARRGGDRPLGGP